MASNRQWTWAPNRRIKPRVPADVKVLVQQKADKLVEEYLKPFCVEPPKDPLQNHLTGIHTRWHHSFFYFAGAYASPGPNRIAPTYIVPFARLEYRRDGKFNMAYFRHTGQWWQVEEGLKLDRALQLVRDNGMFHPPGCACHGA